MDWNKSDKLAVALGCVGTVVAVVLFWSDKTPMTAGLSLAAIILLSIYPVIHFCRSVKIRLAGLVTVAILTALFGASIWPKKVVSAPIAEHNASAPPKQPGTEPTAAVPSQNVVSSLQSRHAVKAGTKPRGNIHGSDNTVVGNTPIQSIDGNGNTIVGTTDANGNTIFNRGGVAIGNGAHADPTSIAIGAHANESGASAKQAPK